MSGDWIKMRGNLWDDPRVGRLCDLTGSNEAAVVGALYWLWATADQHTEDGSMPGMSAAQIDRKTGVKGIGAALVSVGWITESEGGLNVVRFEEHNGDSAKRRCADAKRKANVRNDADKTRTDSGQVAELLRRISELEKEKEKIREEEQETKTARKRAAPSALVSLADLVAEGVNEQHATDWLIARKSKGLPLTPSAWAKTKAEAQVARMTPAEAIKAAAGNGWAGFKAAWLHESSSRNVSQLSAYERKAADSAKWIKGTSLDRSMIFDPEAFDATQLALR